MTIREQIAQQALALPPEDRMYLANLLEQSLTAGEFATAEAASEWSAEIDRRLAAYDRGESQGVDSRKALDRIRAHLVKPRSLKLKS